VKSSRQFSSEYSIAITAQETWMKKKCCKKYKKGKACKKCPKKMECAIATLFQPLSELN